MGGGSEEEEEGMVPYLDMAGWRGEADGAVAGAGEEEVKDAVAGGGETWGETNLT